MARRKKIKRILIANRGEIAVRIIRACHEMGIEAVAVYSDADRWSPFVGMADRAVPIGPAPALQSYLRIDKIMDVAAECKVDALHPGYGFLAENPLLAQACEKAKIRFIGPSAEAIEAAGNKIAARRLAKRLNVPTVPGTTRGVGQKADLKKIEKEIGFPLLVKAAAGGGGKGMRVVEDASEFQKALREASSEAQSAFGDGAVFIERYLERPRHIEIQILADSKGNVIHLGERECSIQRRHQKLVEESPSPIMEPELREAMGAAAVRFAEGVGYCNAGTVEFLVDDERNFYLLEMNTRLQVEHPVTEWATGIDLVQAQIRVAEGAELEWTQDDVKMTGHSIECRINAEDPEFGFVPSTGRVLAARFPEGPFVRVDNGIQSGDTITPHYDSMIAKLSTWGKTRDIAINRMQQALRETSIVGVATTVPFHQQLLQDPRFRAGDIHTGFLANEFHYAESGADLLSDAILIACALESERKHRRRPYSAQSQERSRWRTAGRMIQLRRGGLA